MMAARCAIGLLLAAGLFSTGLCRASERAGTVTFAIDVNALADAKTVKLWFSYPTSDFDQTISNLDFTGNYSSFTLAREPASGALYPYTQWVGPMRQRTLYVALASRVNDFMYPYAEPDGTPLDYFRPKSFRYTIRFQEG